MSKKDKTLTYEPGMTVMFDVVTKSVLVEFRMNFVTLDGPFANRQSGIRAGEAYCRKQGWNDGAQSRRDKA